MRLKFSLLFVIGFGLYSMNAQSQSNRFGMKSGIAISDFTQQETTLGDNTIQWKGSVSYQTGFFYNKRVVESALSIQTEFDYKELRTAFDLREVDNRITTATDVIYSIRNVGWSVLPRIDLFSGKTLNPNFMIGPQVDFSLSSDVLIKSNTTGSDPLLGDARFGGSTSKYNEKVKFGYVMAGGIEIKTKPVIVTIEGRYSSLFTKTFNSEVEELPLNNDTYLLKLVENMREQYYSVLIGFNFYF